MTENKPSEQTNELKDLVVEKEFNQTLEISLLTRLDQMVNQLQAS